MPTQAVRKSLLPYLRSLMKFSLVLLAALVSSHASAAPNKLEAEGVYAADSTGFRSPPRSTQTLIEPDGDIWAADFSFFSAGVASSNSIITGEIDTTTGEGIALDYSGDPPVPLSVKTTITHHTARFLMTRYLEGTSLPYNAPSPQFPFPQSNRGSFDADLVHLPRAKLELKTGSYTTVSPYFAIAFDKDEFTGYNGNCPFTGKVKSGDERHYKRVTLTYTQACYLSGSKQVPVLKNAKLEGVIFASRKSENANVQGPENDVIVMIMRPKAGQYNLGFSKMFNR